MPDGEFGGMSRMVARFIVIAVCAGIGSARADDGASTSASFRLEPATIAAAGRPVGSTTYRSDASTGQAITIGASSSPHYVAQSGFWSFVGTGLVPVVLSVNRTPAAPGSVDLVWSGNNAPYDVFRAASCASVYGSVFVSTFDNAYTDASGPAGHLTCYSVLASAPGPVPPPAAP